MAIHYDSPGHRARSGRSPTRSCSPTCAASPGRWPAPGSGKATASSSTCRWFPRRSSPCWRAHGSGPSTRSSSGASRRRSSRPASTTPGRRWSSPRRAESNRPASSSTNRSSRPPARGPPTVRTCAWSSSASRPGPSSRRATSTGPTSCPRRPPTPAPTASRSPPPTRSTSSTPPARPGSPRASSATTAATPSRMRWSMENVYGVQPGETWFTASDVGWVVGHSYIVYAPLLTGCTTVLYEGKPVGTPDAGAFFRVISEYRAVAMFTAPTAYRAIKREDAAGNKVGDYDHSSLRTLFLAGERLDPDTWEWASHRLGIPVIDNWWQTETGWPVAANPRGIETLPIKSGSPSVPMPGYAVTVLDEEGSPVEPGRRGSDLHQAADAARDAADPLGRRRAVRLVVPVGVRRLLPDRRRRVPGRGRVPLRHGPHRRRPQRRRAPAVDRVDGGGAGGSPRRGRVRHHRGGRRAQGTGSARAGRSQGGGGRRRRRRADPPGARTAGPRRGGRRGVAASGRHRVGPAEDAVRQDPPQDDAGDRRRSQSGDSARPSRTSRFWNA